MPGYAARIFFGPPRKHLRQLRGGGPPLLRTRGRCSPSLRGSPSPVPITRASFCLPPTPPAAPNCQPPSLSLSHLFSSLLHAPVFFILPSAPFRTYLPASISFILLPSCQHFLHSFERVLAHSTFPSQLLNFRSYEVNVVFSTKLNFR